jgi:hypothetical protein
MYGTRKTALLDVRSTPYRFENVPLADEASVTLHQIDERVEDLRR